MSHAQWHSAPLKRSMDIAFALSLLTLFSPLFVLISLIIMTTSPGSVIFKQNRLGFRGKEFAMYKFRSMVNNAEQLRADLAPYNMMNGPVFKMKNDPRITKFGKFIRKTSLDELPQLWNVLRGEMSMVGPRPLPVTEVEKRDVRQRERLTVKPGITCLWQINGRSSIVDFERWMELDLEYVHNCSHRLDIEILAKTVHAVLSCFGAE